MKSCQNLCASCLGSERVHNARLHSACRLSADRDKFSSILVIPSAIRIAFSSIRHRCAVEVCSGQRDLDRDSAAQRNQTKQFSQVSRDLMNDYSDNYRVRGRRTKDLQFSFERLALHSSQNSPGFSHGVLRSLEGFWANFRAIVETHWEIEQASTLYVSFRAQI